MNLVELIKFVFYRYGAASTPTDKQIENAIEDFRGRK